VAELEQTCLAHAEAVAAWNTLSMNHVKLEEDCVGLHAAADTLNREKAQIVTNCEAEIASEQNFFWDYHIGHHKRLHELHMNLEKDVNEIGVWCLPYPGKGQYHKWNHRAVWQGNSSAAERDCEGEQEFLVYCFGGVLNMLYENAECCHLDVLNANMGSCDDSILDEILNDIAKLAVCILKRWGTSHGFPYVTDAFLVDPEVGIFVACCGVWRLLVLTFTSLSWCR
jgi:hypothetical protein